MRGSDEGARGVFARTGVAVGRAAGPATAARWSAASVAGNCLSPARAVSGPARRREARRGDLALLGVRGWLNLTCVLFKAVKTGCKMRQRAALLP